MEMQAATSKILKVKSSRASKKSSMKLFISVSGFMLFPKARFLSSKSSGSPVIPLEKLVHKDFSSQSFPPFSST